MSTYAQYHISPQFLSRQCLLEEQHDRPENDIATGITTFSELDANSGPPLVHLQPILISSTYLKVDLHCHLRDGAMCELVTPMIRHGGADVVYVMPNLQPPITQVSQAHDYHEVLTRLAPEVRFLMSLFLHSSTTPETIAEAARSDIIYGVRFSLPSFDRISLKSL